MDSGSGRILHTSCPGSRSGPPWLAKSLSQVSQTAYIDNKATRGPSQGPLTAHPVGEVSGRVEGTIYTPVIFEPLAPNAATVFKHWLIHGPCNTAAIKLLANFIAVADFQNILIFRLDTCRLTVRSIRLQTCRDWGRQRSEPLRPGYSPLFWWVQIQAR